MFVFFTPPPHPNSLTFLRCNIACVRFVKLVHSSRAFVFLIIFSSTVSGKLKALRSESLLDIILCEYVSGNVTSSNTLSIIKHGSVSKSSKSEDESMLMSTSIRKYKLNENNNVNLYRINRYTGILRAYIHIRTHTRVNIRMYHKFLLRFFF